jgi:tetratricopeptide (TPR) repeat protein
MPAPLELAEAFLHAGELIDALAALDQHLAQQPHDAETRRLRASVLTRLPGRARDALADLDVLGTLTPDDHLWRAQILETLGDASAAFAAVQQAWVLRPDLRSAELLLRQLHRRGDAAAALDLLADLPKTWKWLGWAGEFHLLQSSHALAAQHFCLALEQLAHLEASAILETQRANLLLKRAEAYRRLKRYAEADADYHAAEQIIPNDPLIPFNRGLLVFEQGNLRRALPLCRDALDHAPDTLRDYMRNILFDEPRYHMLAQALFS